MKKHTLKLKGLLAAFLSATMLISPSAVGAATVTAADDAAPVVTGEGEAAAAQLPETGLTYKDGLTEVKMKAEVKPIEDKGRLTVSWEAVPGAKSYKLYKHSKDTANWDLMADYKSPETTFDDPTFHGDYDTATVIDAFLLQAFSSEDASGDAIGNYVSVAAPYLFEIRTGDSTSQALYEFSACIENPALTYNLYAATSSGAYTETAKDSIPSPGLVLDEYTTEDGKTIKSVIAAYDEPVPGFEENKTYYGQVTGTYTLGTQTFTSVPSNEVSFTVTQPQPLSKDTIYTYDIAGLLHTSDNTANLARLERYLKFDGSATAADYTHPGTGMPGVEGGYVIFTVPNGLNQAYTGFDLQAATEPEGSYTNVDHFDMNSVIKCSTELMTGFETWAVFSTKFTSLMDGKLRYFQIVPVGGTQIKTSPCAGIILPDWVQDVTFNAINAKKGKLTWRHDDCVQNYEIYRSNNPAENYTEETKYDLSGYTKIGSVSAKKKTINQGGIKYHQFKDKKVPSADKYYYYVVRPVFSGSAYSEIDLSSEPVEGKGDVSHSKVKSLKATANGLTSVKLEWKGLKNVSTYTIYRGGEFLDEVSVPKKKQTKPQTYEDKTVKPGKGYIYSIRPGNKEGEEGKSTKSNKVDCVPQPITNLKADYRTAGQGAHLSWNFNNTDKTSCENSKYTYTFQVRIDSGAWAEVNTNSWDDTSALNLGAARTYGVRVLIKNGGTDVCASAEVTTKYTSSGNLTVYIENKVDTISFPYQNTIKVGQKAVYYAYSDSQAAMNVVCTSGGGAVTLGQTAVKDKPGKSGLRIEFGGAAVGTQVFELRTSDGAVRQFTINVTQ